MTSRDAPALAKQSASRTPSNGSTKSSFTTNTGGDTSSVRSITVFCILLACHSLAACFSPIPDCDEVFNYWEPTHYLTNGHGFQTWEYAPRYAIRSWAYAGLHSLVISIGRMVFFISSKPAQFYFLRFILGAACAFCETRLFVTVSRMMNKRLGILFLFILATSPGMFYASIAYLPSSFAMYTAMLGASAFMDWRGGLRTAQGIFWFGLGACLGWPFVVALSAPYLVEEAVLAFLTDRDGRLDFVRRVAHGILRALLALGIQVAIDAYFYKRLTIVPLNIVLYNVFSSRGPDLYGMEPWHFYLRNLALNFHIWIPLALLAIPLLAIQSLFNAKSSTGVRITSLRGYFLLSPFYLWLAIFTLQPHKEERFMYPAYPFIALNAAYALHVLISFLGDKSPIRLVSRLPVTVRLTGILALLALALALSFYRIVGTVTAFSAPLSVYTPLAQHPTIAAESNVCLGKEWYRFPSHYFLSDEVKANFIRSEFRGLLPGKFHEAREGFGTFAGTWLEPPGMNDENVEDIGKYTDVRLCDYIVDSSFPSTEVTSFEPDFVHDAEHWERVKCVPFLDTQSTGLVGRLGWVPDSPIVPARLRRVWGEYCLLKRK